MTFLVVAHYRAAADNGPQIADLLGHLAAASRTEPGNLSFVPTQDLADPSHFVIVEEYVDAEAFDAHHQSTHFRRIGLDSIIPLLESRRVDRYWSAPPA